MTRDIVTQGSSIIIRGHLPAVRGDDDVPAILRVDVQSEAGGLVVVQEEGGAVLACSASETKKAFVMV